MSFPRSKVFFSVKSGLARIGFPVTYDALPQAEKESLNNRKYVLWATILNATMMTVTLMAIAISRLELNVSGYHVRGRNTLLKQSEAYSPMFDKFDIPLKPVKMNGTLFPDAKSGPERLMPSPEAEEYWSQWEEQQVYPITAEDLLRMGKNPKTVVKFPESYGLGDDAYMASIDAFHQLHCLSSIRKVAFQNYEPYPTEMHTTDPLLYWVHLQHCFDIIHQNLKCKASMDLIPWSWMEGNNEPFPDFSIYHQCRSWDAIMQYQNEHAVNDYEWWTLRRPADESEYEELLEQDEYFEIHNMDRKEWEAEHFKGQHTHW